jgi:hypothetical protein
VVDPDCLSGAGEPVGQHGGGGLPREPWIGAIEPERQTFNLPLLAWGVPATGVLVETLLDRRTDGDVAEAEAAIERLARLPADGFVLRDILLLRLQALLARAHGDAAAYAHFRDRYRDMARSLGFEGHIAWAEEMP